MKKLESFVQFLCFLPELWSINCPKKCILQFCGDFSKKFRFVKAIYIYASESSYYTLSENGMVYISDTSD